MQQTVKTPLEWSHEMRRTIGFYIAHQDGRTVALIRESTRGIVLQCAGLKTADLFSARYKNATDIGSAKAVCEIHAQKLKPVRNTTRRDSLIGRRLQTDRETHLEDEDDDSHWAC